MSSETRTIGELREHLVKKATEDEAFRARLLSDPKAAIQDELDLAIPAEFTIKVYEDVADTAHLVLPPSAKLGDADLQQAAGGVRKEGESTWDAIWRTLFD